MRTVEESKHEKWADVGFLETVVSAAAKTASQWRRDIDIRQQATEDPEGKYP